MTEIRWTEEIEVPVARARHIAELIDASLLVQSPRTWSMPPGPGPEVTAVRDARGFRWTPCDGWPGYWETKHRTDENGCYPTDRVDTWAELLAWFGPVTDATEEQVA